jgi:hypothetical protein
MCWLLEVFDVEGSAELRAYVAKKLHKNGCDDCHLSTLMDKDKVKPAACEGCYMDDVCYGVWRKYDDHFGAAELRRIEPPEGARPLRRRVSQAPHVARGEVALASTSLGRRWQGMAARGRG